MNDEKPNTLADFEKGDIVALEKEVTASTAAKAQRYIVAEKTTDKVVIFKADKKLLVEPSKLMTAQEVKDFIDIVPEK